MPLPTTMSEAESINNDQSSGEERSTSNHPSFSMGVTVKSRAVYPTVVHEPPAGAGDAGTQAPIEFAVIKRRLPWLKESSGLFNFNALPADNVISEIVAAIEIQRGRKTKAMRKVDNKGAPQSHMLSISVRDNAIRVLNQAWPIHIEATVPTLQWFVNEIIKDLKIVGGPRYNENVTNSRRTSTSSFESAQTPSDIATDSLRGQAQLKAMVLLH
jgi:hypothetical protein